MSVDHGGIYAGKESTFADLSAIREKFADTGGVPPAPGECPWQLARGLLTSCLRCRARAC